MNTQDSSPLRMKVKPAWPEKFGVQKIADIIHAAKTKFGQMYLLDVELSKPQNMRYQEFPAKEIKWDKWPMTLGVDPVGWVKGVSQGEGPTRAGPWPQTWS